MGQAMTGTMEQTSLAAHLLEVFADYAANRKPAEEKWQKNIDAYHAAVHPESGRPVEWAVGEGEDWRSKTRLGVTRQKIATAAAIIFDTTLSGGKLPYLLKLDDAFEHEADAYADPLGQMSKVIDSQVERTRAEKEYYRIVWCDGIYGETWVKCVVDAVTVKSFRELPVDAGLPAELGGLMMTERRFAPVSETRAMPTFKWINPWNMYWDVEARDVADMAGLFHRRDCSAWELRQMAGKPGVIDAAIVKALSEADKSRAANQSGRADRHGQLEPRLREIAKRSRNIRRLEYWGRAPRRKVEEFEALLKGASAKKVAAPEGLGEANDGDEVYIMAVLADDQIVRFARVRPEDNPFGRAFFEEDIESPFGRGPADNLEQIQTTLDGAVRLFEDNKRLSANLVSFIKRRYIKGQFKQIRPGAQYDLSEDCDDARKAVFFPVIPDIGESLISLINLFLQFGDDDSMINRVSQGLPAPGDQSNTATEVTIRDRRSQNYMGMVIRNLDEGVIERVFGWILDFNLADPQHAGYAGPFHVQATGFSSYQSRVVRVTKLQQLLALVLQDPELRQICKVDQMISELFKLSDVDPEQFLRSPEEVKAKRQEEQAQEQEQLAQQAALKQPTEQPPDPTAEGQNLELAARAGAAESDAQGRMMESQARSQAELLRAQGETEAQRMQAEAAAERERAAAEREKAQAEKHRAEAERHRAEAQATATGSKGEE